MPFYKYAGVNKKGETVRGSIDADDEKGARQALLAQGVRVDSLKKVSFHCIAGADGWKFFAGLGFYKNTVSRNAFRR